MSFALKDTLLTYDGLFEVTSGARIHHSNEGKGCRANITMKEKMITQAMQDSPCYFNLKLQINRWSDVHWQCVICLNISVQTRLYIVLSDHI